MAGLDQLMKWSVQSGLQGQKHQHKEPDPTPYGSPNYSQIALVTLWRFPYSMQTPVTSFELSVTHDSQLEEKKIELSLW